MKKTSKKGKQNNPKTDNSAKSSRVRKNILRKAIDKYLRIPFLLFVILVAMNGVVYMLDIHSGFTVSAFLLIYFITIMYVYYRMRPNIITDLMTFSFAQNSIQNELIKELAIPYALVNENGRVLWSNNAFFSAIKSDRQHMRKHIQNIFTDITLELLDMEPEDNGKRTIHIYEADKNYRVEIRRVHIKDLLSRGNNELTDNVPDDEALYAIYFYDETALIKAVDDKEKIKLVVGQIYIDNYEEAMDATEEVRRSLLVALIDRKITKYMQSAKAIIKKLEKDKYIFVIQQQQLELLQEGRFSLLDEIRNINIGNETAVT